MLEPKAEQDASDNQPRTGGDKPKETLQSGSSAQLHPKEEAGPQGKEHGRRVWKERPPREASRSREGRDVLPGEQLRAFDRQMSGSPCIRVSLSPDGSGRDWGSHSSGSTPWRRRSPSPGAAGPPQGDSGHQRGLARTAPLRGSERASLRPHRPMEGVEALYEAAQAAPWHQGQNKGVPPGDSWRARRGAARSKSEKGRRKGEPPSRGAGHRVRVLTKPGGGS